MTDPRSAQRTSTGPAISPYYKDEAVTIYHGDAWTVGTQLFAGWSLITDPPYGFGAYDTDQDHARDVTRLLAEARGCSAVFGYPEQLVTWCVETGLKPSEWVTWWPTNKWGSREKNQLPRTTEHIAIFGSMPGVDRLRRPRRDAGVQGPKATRARGLDLDTAREIDVWRDPAPGVQFNSHLRLHPNEKPLTLMHKLILLCTNEGDTVLDPFCGSGTTLRAAKDLGRKAIGVETEERYCAVAAKRMGQEVLAL